MIHFACVVDFFDEEHKIPWNYVIKQDDGSYEAFVTYLFSDLRDDDAPSEAREHSLGRFRTCKEAILTIRHHKSRVFAVERREWDGEIDFNLPTVN